MTELDWAHVREITIDRFQGQVPRAEDEVDIIDVFEQHPALVMRAIDEVAQALADAKITWAWSVLNKRIERGTTAIRNAKPDTAGDTQRAIQRARTWIDNAGIHYDLERQVAAELFGDEYGSGIITTPLTDDQREELLAYWRAARPRGVKAEQDHLAWNAECAGNREAVQAIIARKKRERETAAEQPAPDPDADIAFTA